MKTKKEKEEVKEEQIAEQAEQATEQALIAPEEEQPELPENAMSYFKRHTDVGAAYFNKFGGVFTADTPKVLVKDAALYQNPFLKQ